MRKTETQEEGGLQEQSHWHPGRAGVSRAGGYALTRRSRKKGSECLLGNWGCGRCILINTVAARRATTSTFTDQDTEAGRRHVSHHNHTAGKRQSENSTQDQLRPDPRVSYRSHASQTFIWMRFHWGSC